MPSLAVRFLGVAVDYPEDGEQQGQDERGRRNVRIWAKQRLEPVHGRRSYARAAVRVSKLLPAGGCKGVSAKGEPCQAKNVYENGFCKFHGGEGQSLLERRQVLRAERIRKSAERMLKKIQRTRRRIANIERRNPELRK